MVDADARADTVAVLPGTAWRLLREWVLPYRGALCGLFVLMLLGSALGLANPWLAGVFTAAVMRNAPLEGLLLAWFGLIVAQAAVAYAVSVMSQSSGARLAADAGTRVFDHVQALPLGWHQARAQGDVLNLLLRDVDGLAAFLTATALPLLPLLLTCAGALFMMLRIEPWFALAASVLIPAVYLAMRWSGRWLRPLGQAALEARIERGTAAVQSMNLLPVVKAFTGEPLESARYAERSRTLRDLDIRMAQRAGLVAPVVRVVSAAAILALLWLASRQLAAGALSADGFVSLLLYGLLLTQPVSALAAVYGQTHVAHATARRIVEVLASEPERGNGELAAENASGEIRFEGVGFAYHADAPVLAGLDLHIRPGEVVAITGANGAGKTTLMHLLMRFIDPTGGRILLDGHDLRDFDLRALRARIGLVPQKVLLFNGSIGENIAYGRVGASQADIEQAARLAQAHGFINGLKDGYATRIGDDGVHLSGGQRQRVALARALLKDPAVLVFDEATAMFDPQGEQTFVEAFRHHRRGRSVLLITHRPASLALADRIVKLQDGRVLDTERETAPGP